MPTQEITNYINEARKSGLSDQEIRNNLLRTGWPEKEVDDSLGITGMIYFILVLNNLIVFVGRGADAIPLFIPLAIYIIASFRFFKKLAKGRK